MIHVFGSRVPFVLVLATIDAVTPFAQVEGTITEVRVYRGQALVTRTVPVEAKAGAQEVVVTGRFAGQGSLPLVARGQSLTLGFGTETHLRAARELEEKTTETRGGNRVIQYTYRIRLSNFMDKAARVRLWDQLPQAPSNQVSITLTDPGQPVSEDRLYVAEEKPRGLLRWDIEVPANASRANAYTFTYKFQVEFDKNYTIGELPEGVAEQMRRDIEAIQHFRMGGLAAPTE